MSGFSGSRRRSGRPILYVNVATDKQYTVEDQGGNVLSTHPSYAAARQELQRLKLEALKSSAKASKRGREVFVTDEIPHLWAHKVQGHARNAHGNLFFRGDTIYSYGTHFPIAMHVTNARGKAAVLFNSSGYSVTTAGHKQMVRSAIPENVPVFEIPDVDTNHTRNLEYYRRQIAEKIAEAARARTANGKTWRLDRARQYRDEAKAYCKFFGIPAGQLPKIPQVDSKELARMQQHERELAANNAKRKRESNAKAIAEWRAGARNHIPYGLPTMLRIEGNEVVTSRGARFPIRYAKRGLRIAQLVKATGVEWKANGDRIRLGHYQLDKISADGTVYAGCHVVPWDEIARIAPEIEAYQPTAAEIDAPESTEVEE